VFSFFFSLFVILYGIIVIELLAASIDGPWPNWQPVVTFIFYITFLANRA